MASSTTARATCWSITINNPTIDDYTPNTPGGWYLTGQLEKGEEDTVHYQGMLKTPQVRFSQVKTYFPRAHIEVSKNPKALAKYVHKEETRIAEVEDHSSDIPTLYDYLVTVAQQWNADDFKTFTNDFSDAQVCKLGADELALRYTDTIVARDIVAGKRGVEFIAVNPMWRNAWKKFHKHIVIREQAVLSNQIIYGSQIPPSSPSCPPSPQIPASLSPRPSLSLSWNENESPSGGLSD